jgi:hypothetical protein
MRKITVQPKAIQLVALAALAFTMQVDNFAAADVPPTAVKPDSGQKAPTVFAAASAKVFNQFEALLKKPGHLSHAITYLNAHIGEATTYQATIMVLHLENAINKGLPSMQLRLGEPSVQRAINDGYKYGHNIESVIARTKDRSLKAFFKQFEASGYKLEIGEGFWHPVVDYADFKKYRPYVTADIKAYIDIMMVESEKASADDGALIIGYQELVNRTLAQENFLKLYPTSNRASKVKALFNHYKTITFYGLENTPLFDPMSKKMERNAQKGYSLILQWHKSDPSPYLTLLRKFMAMAADSDYKLTPEVEKFLRANVPYE